MNKSIQASTLLCILVMLAQATSADAEVIRKHKITTQIMGASETTNTEYYAADRSTSETSTRFTEGMMKTMSGGKANESINITRLDKELIWQLQPDKQTYSEMTFAEFREMMNRGMKDMEEAGKDADSLKSSEDEYTWTSEAKSDPNPKTINGYSCRNVKVVANGVSKKNPEEKIWITLDLWNSKDLPGSDEITVYQQRYMKAIGLDETAHTPGLMFAMSHYGQQFAKLMEEVKKAPGEPVSMTMEVKTRQPAMSAEAGEGEKMDDATLQEMLKSLPPEMRAQMQAQMGTQAGKESKPGEPEYTEMVTMRMNSELVEAKTGAVDGSKFEVPAGYKLVKDKMRGE